MPWYCSARSSNQVLLNSAECSVPGTLSCDFSPLHHQPGALTISTPFIEHAPGAGRSRRNVFSVNKLGVTYGGCYLICTIYNVFSHPWPAFRGPSTNPLHGQPRWLVSLTLTILEYKYMSFHALLQPRTCFPCLAFARSTSAIAFSVIAGFHLLWLTSRSRSDAHLQ